MRGLGVAALCVALACSNRSTHPPPPRLHVPLPAGWSVTPLNEGGLRAGPAGRAVLRVDARPGTAVLPTPADLANEFSRNSQNIRSTIASEISDKDTSISILELSKQGLRARALLGVRRLGADLFLCSSEPGASEEDVAAAAEACKGLSAGGDT